MKTIKTHLKYIEWLSAGDMHDASKEWLSELKFIKDEHLFFEDLITSFTMQLIAKEKFPQSKEIVDAINDSQKRNELLIRAVQRHENDLQIMVDGVDQLNEEKAYTKEHKELAGVINGFLNEYKLIKSRLFDMIKDIKKKEKQKRLIDKA